MRIREIEFPKPLLDAQRAGDLVIFAGAGVSIPPPSNYPNFDSLADEVASGVLVREPTEPVDHFLGRLAHRGVDVHSRVKSLLSNPISVPNSLHYDLLRLFGSAAMVRLATTNFDLHFSAAASTLFNGESPETYSAPALPVGDDFNGLVYLHGSVEKPARRLILTDSDFGHAYLTDGWARRFLRALFAKYIVLFIGYGYSDTVMNYLTRGLPPASGQTRRYALTKVGQADRWNYLGITPLEYALTENAENKHCRLQEAVSKWAMVTNTGVLQTEEKIKCIVEAPVPLDIEDRDYVESSLAELSTVRFFTRHAQRVDWLHWIEGKEPFTRLFGSKAPVTEIDWELAQWFARSFVCKYPDNALAVIRRKEQSITPILWTAIAASFHTEKPPSEVVRKWVPLLIKYPTPRAGGNFLEYTLHRSQYPDDLNSAILLFDYLTRPDIVLEKRWWPEKEDDEEKCVDVELTTEGDDPWIPEVWERLFKPNLNTLADKLIWIVTSHLQRANLLLEAYEKGHPAWDALSARRGVLDSATQGTPPKGAGILIDVAREILEWTLFNRTRTADYLIDIWFSSDCRILKRLAIFGAAKAKHWNADAKMKWILQHNLLYAPGLKHEVFMLLEDAYGRTSEDLRRQVLDRAAGGPNLPDEDPNSIAYEEYNLTSWLAAHAPDSSLTKARLSQILEKHPNFAPREHPDMDQWFETATYSILNSPLGYEELLSKIPEEQLDFIISFEPKDFFRESKRGLLQQLSTAVARDFDWGMRFASAMVGRQLWNSDVWSAILEGWKSSVTADQWPKIIRFLLDHGEVLQATIYTVASLLNDGAEKPDRPIPNPCVDDAIALGEKAWDACTRSDHGLKDKVKDWLFVALNHPAGTLALFFLRMLSKARNNAGAAWNGIPPRYRKVFASIVSGTTYAAEIGRVILASQVLFLFGADNTWAVENIVPLFKWSSDSRRALQAWHGFLAWGHWNDDLLTYMMPNYEETFPVLHAELGEFRERLCSHLAGIAVLSSVDPLEKGWINRFLTTVEPEEREMWASSINTVLKGTTEASKREVWNHWIGKYWRNRIGGIPVPLTAGEVARMAIWVVHLEPVFTEAVNALCESPLPKLKSDYIYHELAQSDVGNRHPGSATRFLLHLLRNQKGPFWGCDYVETVVEKILSAAFANKADLHLVCEQLAHLGCNNAAHLRQIILDA
jgi:SIR2-like domain/Domain of unknown function (DUF4020)